MKVYKAFAFLSIFIILFYNCSLPADDEEKGDLKGGIGNKHSHAKQSNYSAEQTKHQTGYVDQPRAEPDKKRQHQNDRCSYNHQKPFQNLHVISSLQRSWYLF